MFITWVRTIGFLLLNLAQLISLIRSSAFVAKKVWA